MTNNAYTWTDDFSDLCEKYAEYVMDTMDMKSMEQFVFDVLYETYSGYDEQELISEIRDHYGDDVLESLGVSITETPDLF